MEKEFPEIGQLDPKFHDIFSDDELREILDKATAHSEKVIIIITKRNFFELSADLGDSLEIYADFTAISTRAECSTKRRFCAFCAVLRRWKSKHSQSICKTGS